MLPPSRFYGWCMVWACTAIPFFSSLFFHCLLVLGHSNLFISPMYFFRKAFDSIPRERLWQKLSTNGINGKMLDCIKALHKTLIWSPVRVNDELSLTNPTTFDWGVKQGCALSPTLFDVYINDLVDCHNWEAKGISFGDCKITFLFYADDLYSYLIGNTPAALQKLLDALDDWPGANVRERMIYQCKWNKSCAF